MFWCVIAQSVKKRVCHIGLETEDFRLTNPLEHFEHDIAATDELGKLAASQDVFVSEAAAHSLGKIGTSAAAKALDAAAGSVQAKQLWAIYESELRCAENLAATGKKDEAIAIYDKLRVLKEPQQVRAAGLRGALIVREKEGLSLLAESLRGEDWILADAAARAAIEMKLHGAPILCFWDNPDFVGLLTTQCEMVTAQFDFNGVSQWSETNELNFSAFEKTHFQDATPIFRGDPNISNSSD